MGDGPGISNSGITSLVDTIEFYDTFRGDFLVIYDDVCTAGAPAECALRLPDGVAFHTATALEDGRVLIVGGLKLSGGDALLPTSSAYVLELTGYAEGNLTQVNYESDVFPSDRAFHTATRMADGRVVIIGGIGRTFGPEPTFQSDIYQVLPQAELVIGDSGADLNNVRGLHTATFFQRHAHGIIVVGGRNANGVVGTSEVVYAVSSGFDDPLGVDVFASGNSANDLSVPRFGHSAVSYSCPFTDEEFLAVVGGFTEATGTFVEGASPTPTVEVYQPDQFEATQLYTWSTTTAQLANEGRAFGAAVGLPISGDLIFAGGLDASGAPSRAADRVYVEDWSQCEVLGPARQIVGGMGTARAFFALAPLDSGFLLATGGFNGTASVESTEFFNPNDYALVADNLQ
jgi:hypothetical protein